MTPPDPAKRPIAIGFVTHEDKSKTTQGSATRT